MMAEYVSPGVFTQEIDFSVQPSADDIIFWASKVSDGVVICNNPGDPDYEPDYILFQLGFTNFIGLRKDVLYNGTQQAHWTLDIATGKLYNNWTFHRGEWVEETDPYRIEFIMKAIAEAI